jgi:protein TonB
VVGISFVIGKDGSVTDINLYRGTIYSQLNNEAMRVITKMPKWEPGRQNGKPVKVRMILPIRFELKE